MSGVVVTVRGLRKAYGSLEAVAGVRCERLFELGAAAFVDAGYAWPEGAPFDRAERYDATPLYGQTVFVSLGTSRSVRTSSDGM